MLFLLFSNLKEILNTEVEKNHFLNLNWNFTLKAGITNLCTHLHSIFTQLLPPPPNSFQPPPSSIHFHPAHFSFHPALCNPLNNIRTKILHVIGRFPQIWAVRFKVVYFDKKWTLMVSWKHWFWIQTQIFKIPTSKSIFRQICAQKVKVIRFAWKLTHMVSQRYWLLF